jgi:hypothetical protein
MMKGRHCLTAAIALLVIEASAMDIASSGDWTRTINAADLTGGAGTDLNSEYDSPVGITSINISNGTGSWQVTVRRDTSSWPAGLHVWVRRTSDGTGTGSISGGAGYVEITTLDTVVFSGAEARNNVALQFRVTGLSKNVTPDTYVSSVIYTVTP